MQPYKPIRSISIVGSGHCGRQIAFLTAKAGLVTRCFEPSVILLEDSRKKFYEKFGLDSNLTWTSNIAEASSSDLILESVPESLEIKRDALKPFMFYCDSTTILASNSSYLAPSMIFRGFPHPERFAALHFHVPPWFATAVDVMPAPRTSKMVIQALTELVIEIGLTPIVLQREFPGYVFNNLLHPLLIRSMELVERGVCAPEDIERSWRAITHMPVGPFGMMLEIGLPSLRTILENALGYLDDPSIRRAYQFLVSWDGVLDPVRCAPIFYPQAGFPRVATKPVLDKFSRFELVWETSDPSFAPNCDSHEILREHWESCVTHQNQIVQEEQGNEEILFWPNPSGSETTVPSSLEERDLASELVHLVTVLKSNKAVSERLRHPKPLILACTSDSSRLSHQLLPGLSGLARSIWLEGLSTSSLDSTEQIHFHGPKFHLLEIDFHARSTPSHNGKPQIFEKNDRDVPNQFLHVHQRFHGGEWQVQKLRRLSDTEESSQPASIPLRDNLEGTRWLISGGGRGITFELARFLGEHGAKLELLGRTPTPTLDWYAKSEDEIEAIRKEMIRRAASEKKSLPAVAAQFDATCELSRNLHVLDTAKIEYFYHAIDVSNRNLLSQLYTSLVDQRTPIHGFLHGAGFEQTSVLSKKSVDSIRTTIMTKVRGALNLESLITQSTRWFIQCGSLAGYFGGIGQVDYAAANGFLGERAAQLSLRWPELQSLTIAWPGWADIGMAARPSSKWALQHAGHTLMPFEEGLRHFQWLLEHKCVGYVLICNPSEIPTTLFATGDSNG
ncbi:MAG: KR domain-containing protein [Planctomycetes bacterium]|nr:KR domain-containing protein [Planctomycetota bacterium]